MKIGEIASAAGVSTSRIRFYEKRGIIPPAIRDDNGYRDYSPDLIGQLNFIEQAQKLGFTLKEIISVEPGSGDQRKKEIKALIAQLEKSDS